MATLTNTEEQRTAALAKFNITADHMANFYKNTTNFVGGHIMLGESDGPGADFPIENWWINRTDVLKSFDAETLRLSFLVIGNGEETPFELGDETEFGIDHSRLVAGV